MTFIDSHAHLTAPEIFPEIEGILARAKTAGVSHILNICTDPESLSKGILLTSRHPNIKNAGATPPQDVLFQAEEAFFQFEEAAASSKLAAIGETGLDYHYDVPKEIQKKYLVRYLYLAASLQLPAIFHCREAFSDLFSIVDAEYSGPAILHCFTGNLDEAEEVLKRGWYLSLSGIVTFKKSETLREVAKIVPLSQLLIETDAPYLAPGVYRGKINEPSYILETAKCVAQAKGISVEKLAEATTENARNLFFLDNLPLKN
jgi:TatD DNase family protein